MPFPGNCNIRVLSPWSDSRNPYTTESGHYTIYVPNTKNGTNVGMEVVSENSVAGYFTVKLYQTAPENLSPSKPKNLSITSVPDYGSGGWGAGGIGILSPPPTHYHPKISWTASAEPDMNQSGAVYEVYRSICNNTNFSLLTTVPYTQTYYQDNSVQNGSQCWVYYRIKAKDTQGYRSGYSNEVNFRSNIAQKIAVRDDLQMPAEFMLRQNYPNPFNPETKIAFSIPEDHIVKLIIFDVLGREIATPVNEFLPSGNYEVNFDASTLPSGVYFYRLVATDISSGQTVDYTDIKKMILMK